MQLRTTHAEKTLVGLWGKPTVVKAAWDVTIMGCLRSVLKTKLIWEEQLSQKKGYSAGLRVAAVVAGSRGDAFPIVFNPNKAWRNPSTPPPSPKKTKTNPVVKIVFAVTAKNT